MNQASRLSNLEGYFSPQIDAQVRLNTNESPYPPSRKFQRAFIRKIKELELQRYPSRGAENLKRAILDFYGFGGNEEGGNEEMGVVVGNGSNEILQAVLLTYAGSAGKVGVFEPTYALHSHIAKIVGAEVISGTRNEELRADREELKKVLSQGVDLVFLCSPNNPTGISETSDFLKEALELTAESGALLVVDEAYGEFRSGEFQGVGAPASGLELLKENLPLVLVRTFSKSWSLAGMRLGYGIAPGAIVQNLEKAFLPYNLNAATQAAGELMLDFAEEMDTRAKKIAESRELMFENLVRINETIKENKPRLKLWESSANFIFFQVEGGAAEDIWKALINKSILIRYYKNSPFLRECLRVTIGSPSENERFLEAIEEILI